MIRLQFTGNIGRDAVVRQAGKSNAISFAVAHTQKYKSQGEWKSKTTWVNCTLWREDGKTGVAELLTKGVKVYVEGEPSASHYVKGEEVVTNLECRVMNVEILTPKQKTTADENESSSAGEDDDDLPF